jgi:hypothetical protein
MEIENTVLPIFTTPRDRVLCKIEQKQSANLFLKAFLALLQP